MRLRVIEAGDGAPVVLLHGLFGAARNFARLQRRLAAGRRVLALDLRNHGGSPHAPDMDYATLAADVLETLRALDALPCALIGHSMGGKTAMRAALDEPTAITRLLVADIAPVRYAPRFRDLANAMLALPVGPAARRSALDAALAAAVPDAALRGFLLQSVGPDGWQIDLPTIAASLPAIEDWDAPADCRYAGPVLFVAGERSDYVRAEHRPAIRAAFPAARFLTLRGAGHWLHADNPEGFAAVTEAFLSHAA